MFKEYARFLSLSFYHHLLIEKEMEPIDFNSATSLSLSVL